MDVYGMNHVALEVTDIDLAVKFYTEVFGLERQREGEGQAFFKVGEHQFLALANKQSAGGADFVIDRYKAKRPRFALAHRHAGYG